MACSSCQAKAESKIEEQVASVQEGNRDEESVSDDVLAVAQGEKEAPSYWGPLNRSWNGPVLCHFCFVVGILLSILIGGGLGWAAQVYGGLTGANAGLVGISASLLQLGFVLWAGWHPAGPVVYKLLNVLPSRSDETEDDQPTSSLDVNDVPSDDELEQAIQSDDEEVAMAARELKEAKEAIHEERGRADELREEKEELKRQLDQVRERKQQVEEQKDEVVEYASDVEYQFERHADFHNFRERKSERVPVFAFTEGGIRYKVGHFAGYVETEAMEERGGTLQSTGDKYLAAIIVQNRGDQVGQIPEMADENTREAFFNHLYPHPTEVNTAELPEVRHPGENQWRPENGGQDGEDYPRVLFQEDMSELRDARRKLDEATDIPKRVSLTISYDENGNYVPPCFSPKGFESRQQLRGNLNELKETNSKLQWQANKLNEENDRLASENEHLEQELNKTIRELKVAQQERLEAISTIREAEEEREVMAKEADMNRRRAQRAQQRAEEAENEALDAQTGNQDRMLDRDRAELEAASEKFQQKEIEKYFSAAKLVGFEPEHGRYTLDDVGDKVRLNGSEEVLDKERVVQDFLNSDKYDRSQIEEVTEDFESEVEA